MTDKQLNPRDVFECEYIARHMVQDVYADAKSSLESLRNGLTYDDEGVERAFNNWIMGDDISQEPSKSNRIGDIHIGGEITEEFKNSVSVVATGFTEEYCKHCGLNQSNGDQHLHYCQSARGML